MGKINVGLLRYLSKEDYRVLTSIEMAMRNHELVNGKMVAMIAQVQGVHEILMRLSKERLVAYERGKRYDGYRLTNLGYDFLALKSFVGRNVVTSFGNQIGVGKEADVYVVGDEEKEICLKIHRLGRTSFRKIKEKRDYHQHRNNASWIYLSRLSATREFAYMKALYDRGFPVPTPIDFNRHCVLMDLVKGAPLCQLRELSDPAALYEDLMNLLLKLANYGVIHSDFNEFNIMIDDDEKPILIDFPQMVSTSHSEAENLFNRDVKCLRDFFKRRFNFEGEEFPVFSDIVREASVDVEVSASGHLKTLKAEYEIEGDEEGHEEEESEEEEGEEEESEEEEGEEGEVKENLKVEEIKEDQQIVEKEEVKDHSDIKEEVKENQEIKEVGRLDDSFELITDNFESFEIIDPKKENESCLEIPTEEDDELTDAMSHNWLPVGRSKRATGSVSSMSTIHPDVIKKQVKKNFTRQKNQEVSNRIRAKGEASAVTRKRKENNEAVRPGGIWGWDN